MTRGHPSSRLFPYPTLFRSVVPVVPELGSVGASGDLAPLAHLALALIGEGRAYHRGELMPSRGALQRAGLEPVVLERSEEHTSELQSRVDLVCRLLLEKKKV